MIVMLCMAIHDQTAEETSAKKKKSSLRYVLYISIVLVVTIVSLVVSLWGHTQEVMNAFAQADVWMILLMVGLVALGFVIDGIIILVFCRLYTRTYKFHQGIAATLVGQFYSNVTPGASGGQIMEAYTMKSQGIQISNAASIMVMWFIIFQSALIGFDVVALIFEWNTVMSITAHIQFGSIDWTLPMWPLILIGFGLNLFVIVMMFSMSYSHRFHNFILHYVIGFLAKIRLIKKPDKTRENLRVQVENFKIELRRLQSNIPVLILQFTLFVLLIFLRDSIPYFAGLSLKAWGPESTFDISQMFHASFLSSFHQMVTGLIPLPGSAGVSELFYSYLFHDFYAFLPNGTQNPYVDIGATIASTQILWRTVTFHFVLVVSGLVAALYRSRGQQTPVTANRQTFVDLQLETFDERKISADTMYETAQLSRRELLEKLRPSRKGKAEEGDESTPTPKKSKKPKAQPKKRSSTKSQVDETVGGKKKRRKKNQEDDWDKLEI